MPRTGDGNVSFKGSPMTVACSFLIYFCYLVKKCPARGRELTFRKYVDSINLEKVKKYNSSLRGHCKGTRISFDKGGDDGCARIATT